MKLTKARKKESIRLFENPVLEKTTHVHPLVPLCLWFPIAAVLIVRSFTVLHLAWTNVLFIGFVGFFVWTLTEYLLHRYFFHLKASGPKAKWLVYLIHGHHHDDPEDSTRLVMPPTAGIILAIPLLSVFIFIMGPIEVQPFFGFFLLAYLWYDYTHYAVHFFKPRTAWGKYVKQHHMQHHFMADEAKWGVSSPFWDHVFQTNEPVTSRKKRNLEEAV